MGKIKDIIVERLALAGLFLLMCAARCQAQGVTYGTVTADVKIADTTPPTPRFQNGVFWEQILTNPPILVKITYVDGVETRTEYPREWPILTFGGILESNTPIDTTPPTSIITAVHDGDSYYFRGLVPSNKFARLNGVDCPEISSPYVSKTQPYGREIGDSVRILLKGRQITYTVYGLDKLKRPLVGVFVNETDVAEILLTKGWAWYYSPNNLPSATKRLYKSLERTAKKKKLGLWADPAAIKPTAWRKQHPGLK